MDDKRMLANRYELIRKIGSGGMAVVYQAYDTSLDRQVAIKLLREEYIDDPDFIRQFQKEAKAVARLSHQNIVNIYDFGESDGVTYLVMEYVEGSTLKEIIAQYGPLPIDQVIDYSVQVCSGMVQAHSQQIVHKDIKPHNIMVDRNHVVKITDFGIAQAMNNLTITHNKGILGSAHYFSPEQARGDHVDVESDIYSMGIVMYEMVSGKVPFTGDNPVTVALKHMQEQPPSLLAQRADVPLGLERIIFKALEKNPAYRFKSMQEMVDALLDLQLYLEERGFFQRDGAATPIIPSYEEPSAEPLERSHSDRKTTNQTSNDRKSNDRKNNDRKHGSDRNRTERNNLTEESEDGHTRVLNHDYLRESTGHSGKRKTKKSNVIVLAAVAVLLFLGSFWLVQSLLTQDEVAVPDLTDKTLLEAEALLSDLSLKIVVEEETYDSDIEKDHIIRQDPKAETMVREGREVSVVISLGSNQVAVPDLMGKTRQEATIALENEELELGVVTMVTDSKQDPDVVVFQSVEAGSTVEAGTKIDVMINEDAEALKPEVVTVSVPSLTGQTLADAQKALTAAHLQVGTISRVASDEYYSDYVIVQGAAAGSSVVEQTAVDLTVSSGPGPEQSAQFELIIPEDGTVVVNLTDATGTSVLYQKDCVAGERVQQSFLYHGQGTITITCNEREIWSRVYEA